jgi:hypothetical protein
MNRRLTDECIRATYRELQATKGGVSGRQLRRELRERFGAVGKTKRVFQIWREESLKSEPPPALQLPTDVRELQARMLAAESAAAENQARAERAEYREQAHQDRWAAEIDRLRQEARARPTYLADIRVLQERVLKLSLELQDARAERSPSE